MLISLRADGTAEMLLPSHVYQGSNVANVYVIAPFPNTTALQVGFTLPNGTTASAPMTYVQDSENNLVVWQYTIAAAITNEAGAAYVSITATTTTGQVIASQSIPFTIEATTLPVLPDTPSQDEWTLVLQYIQQNSTNIATIQGQISTIEEDVATASSNASAAVETANQAQQDANDLSTEVAQLKDQIVEKQGTAVSVGGDYVANIEFTSDPQTQIDNIIIGATTVGKATADGNGNIFANYYLPINNKTLPSLSNNNVSQSTLKELCDSFNLKYGESTIPLYFESGTDYSNIQGLIKPSGVTYKQYNILQVTRQEGSIYIITVYAGYNAQVQMTIPPQFFFVTSGGISPATDNIRFKNTVTDLNVQLSPVASSGIFNYGNNTSNAPTADAGTLIHYQFTANYATQMAVPVNQNGYIYRRTYYNGSWGDWKSALIINISNLKPWEDSTGWSYGSNPKLTAAGLYLVAAAYTPSSQAPFYYMPTIMPFDGENGIAPIFDRDGLMDNGKVVANDEGIQVRSGPTKVDTTLIYYQKIS